MLIVLIILTVLTVIVGIFSFYDDRAVVGSISWTLVVILVISSIACIFYIVTYMVDGITAKPKIEMYQEENEKIEEDINILVKEYMEYEKDTYKEFKTESVTTLIALFPDLKSDELVNKQINIYVENNNKIKELKEKEIDMSIGKWLLYFGN